MWYFDGSNVIKSKSGKLSRVYEGNPETEEVVTVFHAVYEYDSFYYFLGNTHSGTDSLLTTA